jgi:hypothetical protein
VYLSYQVVSAVSRARVHRQRLVFVPENRQSPYRSSFPVPHRLTQRGACTSPSICTGTHKGHIVQVWKRRTPGTKSEASLASFPGCPMYVSTAVDRIARKAFRVCSNDHRCTLVRTWLRLPVKRIDAFRAQEGRYAHSSHKATS